MRKLLSIVAIAFVAGGCSQQSRPAKNSTAHTDAEAGFKLPEAVSGQPADAPVLNALTLNVNSKGEVVPPFDREGDTETLSGVDAITSYIRRRADVERMETGNERPGALPVVRVDRETPFEKLYPILRACQHAGYEKCQLRVRRPSDDMETRITLKIPCLMDGLVPCMDGAVEPPRLFTVRVAANDSGQLTELSFREEGSSDDSFECLGANIAAYESKIRHIADNENKRIAFAAAKGSKIPQPSLTLEIGDKLPQKTVVQMLDIALQAGFGDVWFTPIDPAKR